VHDALVEPMRKNARFDKGEPVTAEDAKLKIAWRLVAALGTATRRPGQDAGVL
jgi:hypothetical protein